jgi:hypothetical protein
MIANSFTSHFNSLLLNTDVDFRGRHSPDAAGGREPPRRYAPAGSPFYRYFPQESRAFHYNQHTAKKSIPYFNTALIIEIMAFINKFILFFNFTTSLYKKDKA